MKSLYVDPRTGDFSAVRGRPASCSRALGKVLAATRTEKGSVPGLPDFGFDLSLLTHVGTRTARRVEAEVDRVIRPLVGVDLVRFERKAWVDAAGILCLRLFIVSPDGEDDRTIEVG